jgi:hypothetical protein
MARTIRVSDIGDYASQQMEKLLRAAVLETDALVKQASPVKTGRFSASWQVGENAAPGGVKPPGALTKHLRRLSALATGKRSWATFTASTTTCHMQSLSPMAAASRLLVLKVVKPAGCRVRPKMCRAEY